MASSSRLDLLGLPRCKAADAGHAASLEKLRTEAAEAAMIRDLATDPEKRALYTRLTEHLSALASEVEKAIASKTG
jgi:hypothetical protein